MQGGLNYWKFRQEMPEGWRIQLINFFSDGYLFPEQFFQVRKYDTRCSVKARETPFSGS